MEGEEQDPNAAVADLAIGFDLAEPVEILAARADDELADPRFGSACRAGFWGAKCS
jgi:hypothetical protein